MTSSQKNGVRPGQEIAVGDLGLRFPSLDTGLSQQLVQGSFAIAACMVKSLAPLGQHRAKSSDSAPPDGTEAVEPTPDESNLPESTH